MKKLILFLSAMLMTLTANAQFKEGKGYLGASLTGLNTNWNSKHGFNIGAEAKADAAHQRFFHLGDSDIQIAVADVGVV